MLVIGSGEGKRMGYWERVRGGKGCGLLVVGERKVISYELFEVGEGRGKGCGILEVGDWQMMQVIGSGRWERAKGVGY